MSTEKTEEKKEKKSCDCVECKLRRGELKGSFAIRREFMREFRRVAGTISKELKICDGFAVGANLRYDGPGGPTQKFMTAVSPSREGVESAADIAGKAIVALEKRYDCSREAAEDMFRGLVLERLHEREGAAKNLFERIAGLLGPEAREKMREIARKQGKEEGEKVNEFLKEVEEKEHPPVPKEN